MSDADDHQWVELADAMADMQKRLQGKDFRPDVLEAATGRFLAVTALARHDPDAARRRLDALRADLDAVATPPEPHL